MDTCTLLVGWVAPWASLVCRLVTILSQSAFTPLPPAYKRFFFIIGLSDNLSNLLKGHYGTSPKGPRKEGFYRQDF